MCHPGHVDEELRAMDPVTVTREQELAFLLSPRFTEMLERRKLKLGRLGEAAGEAIILLTLTRTTKMLR